MKTQTEKIGDHLMKVGSISWVEAADLYRVRSLTRRIADLREQDWPIESEWRRDTLGQRYVRYILNPGLYGPDAPGVLWIDGD